MAQASAALNGRNHHGQRRTAAWHRHTFLRRKAAGHTMTDGRVALVSITEAAAANGKSVALLRLRCGEGRVKGAVRIGNRWAVPAGELTSCRRCARAVRPRAVNRPPRPPASIRPHRPSCDRWRPPGHRPSRIPRRSARPEQHAPAYQCQGARARVQGACLAWPTLARGIR